MKSSILKLRLTYIYKTSRKNRTNNRCIKMPDLDYLHDLEKCTLCEHRCRVNRLKGETGVCKVTMPTIASATLHPAPPKVTLYLWLAVIISA